MDNYLKYYWLETEYLEKEVYADFHAKGFLTEEQFFAIIFWKSKRPAKKWIRPNLTDAASDKHLTAKLYEAKEYDKKLETLLLQKGFNIAMASGILTILYPDIFTVYDYRLRDQINKYLESAHKPLVADLSAITDIEKKKKLYWSYVSSVREVYPDLSLRNSDRVLWAKSWYEYLKDFLADKTEEDGSVEKSGLVFRE